MIHETQELNTAHHLVKVTLTDDFGHRHEVVYPTHVGTEDQGNPYPKGPVTLVPFPIGEALKNAHTMMAEREQAFLAFCLAHPVHSQHPVVLAHPDHPSRKPADLHALDRAMKTKDCKDCG